MEGCLMLLLVTSWVTSTSAEYYPTCAYVDEHAVSLKNRTCTFQRNSTGFIFLTCESINGYRPVGDVFSILHHVKFMFTLTRSRTPSGSWFLNKLGYSRQRIQSDSDYKNISHVNSDSDVTSGHFGTEITNFLFSEGFRSVNVEYNSKEFGCMAVLDTDPNCRNCTINLRVMNLPPSEKEDKRILQYARKVDLRFVENFAGLAKFYFSLINGSRLLEELRVSGGENWGDTRQMIPTWPNLRRLDLGYTGLTELDPENFESIPRLEELLLPGNAIEEIPKGISILTNLTLLDLSWNPLTTENWVKVLRPLRRLEWLLLGNASLHSLDPLLPLLAPSRDDSPYAMLQGLDVSFCQLHTVDTEAASLIFSHQTELRFLSLAGNRLGYIPAELFRRLSHLSALNLSSTGLVAGPGLWLAPGVSLDVLDVSHNQLSAPGGVVAQGTVLLLNLSGNPLRPWEDPAAFRDVRALDLSHCALSELAEPALRSLSAASLRAVDLSGNLLDCAACSVPALRKWLLVYERRVTPRPLTCSLPPASMGRSVLQAQWSEAVCRDNTVLVVAATLGALLGLLLFLTWLAYRFRFEVRYILHLVRVNRTPSKTENGDCQYDAFICYSGTDRPWVVRELLPRLEGGPEGYSLCLHERDFILGSFISHNIVTCIQSSRHTIVVLTNNFVKSQWCQWELDVASHRLLDGTRDFLILVELERLERRSLPRHLRLLMDTRTFLEWPSKGSSSEGAWKRLRMAMGPSLKQASASKCGETEA